MLSVSPLPMGLEAMWEGLASRSELLDLCLEGALLNWLLRGVMVLKCISWRFSYEDRLQPGEYGEVGVVAAATVGTSLEDSWVLCSCF